MLKKGLFITLEGPDGCGKTTQAQKLYEYLTRQGYQVVRTREPGGTKVAEQVREVLLSPANKVAPLAEIFLYEAVRAQHVEELIKPSLAKGKIIVCERFSDATFAYQGYGRRLPLAMIKALDKFATAKISPDLTILLDIPPELGLSRVLSDHKNRPRGQTDRMEQEDLTFHRRVRAGYLKLARSYPRRIKAISAQQPADEIHGQIIKYVERAIRKRK
ncbi:MAG: dTMP kinase [bacterium]